jgi:hypothetical protein
MPSRCSVRGCPGRDVLGTQRHRSHVQVRHVLCDEIPGASEAFPGGRNLLGQSPDDEVEREEVPRRPFHADHEYTSSWLRRSEHILKRSSRANNLVNPEDD